MQINVFREYNGFQDLLQTARQNLQIIRENPSPEPANDSNANLAFDPYTARRLNTFVPLRVIPVPPSEDTWKLVDGLLDGWCELGQLSLTTDLTTWDVRHRDRSESGFLLNSV